MERVYGNEEGGGGRKTVESFLWTYSSPLQLPETCCMNESGVIPQMTFTQIKHTYRP